MGINPIVLSSERRSLERISAGIVAAVLFLVAQGILSRRVEDDYVLGDVALALVAHVLAATLVFVVFFKRRRTRVRSLEPLAEAPLEVNILGREHEVGLSLGRLRARLGWTYIVVGLVGLGAAVSLLLAAKYGHPAIGLLIEARGGAAWLTLAVLAGTISFATARGLLAHRPWGLPVADAVSVSCFIRHCLARQQLRACVVYRCHLPTPLPTLLLTMSGWERCRPVRVTGSPE